MLDQKKTAYKELETSFSMKITVFERDSVPRASYDDLEKRQQKTIDDLK